MKTGYIVGIGAVIGGGVWFTVRIEERRKLVKKLEAEPKLQLIAAANELLVLAGRDKWENLTPKKLAANKIKLFNTIGADKAYAEILVELPECAVDGEGPCGEDDKSIVDDYIPPSGDLDFLPHIPLGQEKEEGRVPDAIPIIGTKEKWDWWKSWVGMN